MTVQIFVYNCVFRKKEKQNSRNLSLFENENTFQKNILKMKTPFKKEPHPPKDLQCPEILQLMPL